MLSIRTVLPIYQSFVVFGLIAAAMNASAENAPAFRTDANNDKSLPWYQLVDGKFPPEGSAHAISGELIRVDHLERRFLLRVDRNDSQDRGVWDLPVNAVMLPYGSLYYHGSPAALRDIPLGTHLHGLFYLKDPKDTYTFEGPHNNRKTPDVDFVAALCWKTTSPITFGKINFGKLIPSI